MATLRSTSVRTRLVLGGAWATKRMKAVPDRPEAVVDSGLRGRLTEGGPDNTVPCMEVLMSELAHAPTMRFLSLLAAAAVLGGPIVGCEESDEGLAAPANEGTAGAGGSADPDSMGLGGAVLGEAVPDASAWSPEGPDASDPDLDVPPPQEDDEALPCEVSKVLATHCSGCHGEVPRFGAPMALVTWEDLQAPARSEPGRPVYELVLDRMVDVQRPMPPLPRPAADEAEISAMQDWVTSGAMMGESCDDELPPPPIDDVADGPLPPPHPDCDHVFELRAHGRAVPGDETPYPVPPLTDLYVNFTFQVPWTGSAHGISFHPIVDDDRVLHHWLLYTAPLGAILNGAITPGIGTHPGEALVAGWAPGGIATEMPDTVGMELPTGPLARFVLEMHYHNEAGYLDARDRSGVRVCATTNKRPNTAAVHLLGTEIIAMAGPGEFRFTGLCHPWLNLSGLVNRTPVNILTSSPHLHRRGTHLTTTIHRAAGGTDTLLDTPFDFDNQITHQTPQTLFPGDWLKTTCTYQNPGGIAGFGVRTQDEMCQNYVTAWPVGALDTGGSLIFAAHACML